MSKMYICRFVRFFCSLTIVLSVFSTARSEEQAGASPAVRNLILMIGDGMGPEQVRLAGDYANRPLAMTSLPVHGAIKTASSDSAVTDSAAAGTALACGKKTKNHSLGQLPDGTKLVSIAEKARDAGKRVGIISSVPVNHATPAAFYAKVADRNSYYNIGLQAVASKFDVLGGSDISDADGKNKKQDPKDSLWKLFEQAGYTFARTPAALKSCIPGGKVVIIPEKECLYSGSAAPYAAAFDPAKHIKLAHMTAKSLELLNNTNGFFLMVEGGSIDWAGHSSDAVKNLAEVLEFDDAVAQAKSFAESHPNTLLVVTADHETGGLKMLNGYTPDKMRAILSKQTCTLGNMTDDLNKNVRATVKDGLTDAAWNSASKIFATTLGLEAADLTALEEDYKAVISKDNDKERQKKLDNLIRGARKLRDTRAGIEWTSSGNHTATDVPVFAFGPGSKAFEGTQDNTSIPSHGTEYLLPPTEQVHP